MLDTRPAGREPPLKAPNVNEDRSNLSNGKSMDRPCDHHRLILKQRRGAAGRRPASPLQPASGQSLAEAERLSDETIHISGLFSLDHLMCGYLRDGSRTVLYCN